MANVPSSTLHMLKTEIKKTDTNVNYATGGAVKIGDSVKQFVQEQILPMRQKFEAVTECWSQLLPADLSKHCKIVELTRGRLKVKACSPSYLYELQLRRSEILEQLQKLCPRAKIKTIKFVVG